MNPNAKVLLVRYDDGSDVLRVFLEGGPPAYPYVTRSLDSGRRILHCDSTGQAVRVDFRHASRGVVLHGVPNAPAIKQAAAEIGIEARL
jgi:hypothetical protein